MLTCFECGAPADHQHHVVPRSKGGTRTIPLCAACHGKVHGHALGGRKLTKDALGAKKARGERTGSVPYGYTMAADGVHLEAVSEEQEVIAEARRLHGAGQSLRGIARELLLLGHTSRNGRIFEAQQIHRMLHYKDDMKIVDRMLNRNEIITRGDNNAMRCMESVLRTLRIKFNIDDLRYFKKYTYSVDDCARLFDCQRATVIEIIESGMMKAAKIGRLYRVSQPDLRTFYFANGGGRLFADDAPEVPEA